MSTHLYDPRNLPIAGPVVDGRDVGDSIPNMGSISASIDDPEVLSGIREVRMSDFGSGSSMPSFYSVEEENRTLRLAEKIRASNWIDPLIVVYDRDGPYILEGGHRFDALRLLGAKSFPAKVVIDDDFSQDPDDPSIRSNPSVPLNSIMRKPTGPGMKGLAFLTPNGIVGYSWYASERSGYPHHEFIEDVLYEKLEGMQGDIDSGRVERIAYLSNMPSDLGHEIQVISMDKPKYIPEIVSKLIFADKGTDLLRIFHGGRSMYTGQISLYLKGIREDEDNPKDDLRIMSNPPSRGPKMTKAGNMTVETWYDRQEFNAWVTQLRDANGDQVGDAQYSPSRFEAMESDHRELVEKAAQLQGLGDCYPWAIKNIFDYKDKYGAAKIVHANVTNVAGRTFGHAWIEANDRVYDWHMVEKMGARNGVDRSTYYSLVRPENIRVYTPKEAWAKRSEEGHCGPWE